MSNHQNLGYRSRVAPTKAEGEAVAQVRTWVLIRDPGCVPQRKGPIPPTMLKSFLREVFKARPTSYVTVVHATDDNIGVEDGPEYLEMLDGRSAPTARAHRKRLRA